MANELKGT